MAVNHPERAIWEVGERSHIRGLQLKAPVNTIVGTATGQFNGMDGYTVTFEVQDNGAPGKDDEVYFVVYQTSNPRNVVLWVPLQFLDSGNVQVKFDLLAIKPS